MTSRISRTHGDFSELQQVYQAVFDGPAGERILADLRWLADRTRVDRNNPNPQAALYRAAQHDLINFIERMLIIGGDTDE